MKNKITTLLIFGLTILSYGQENNKLTDSISVEEKIQKAINVQSNILDKKLESVKLEYKRQDAKKSIQFEEFSLNLNKYKHKIDSLSSVINFYNDNNEYIKNELNISKNIFTSDITNLSSKTDSLKKVISLISKDLSNANTTVSIIAESSTKNTSEIENVNHALSQKQQYSLIISGFSLALLLLVYIILNKKRTSDTKKLAAKQKEIFEKQIEDSQQLTDWLSSESAGIGKGSKEVDHSFAKRVADEIVRITTNLSRMDESIKGFKQLAASVRKLEQSLNANHYEIENLLNMPYNSGMNIQANIIIDENLKAGESTITRIIKPQINYKGKLIQAAQVEVSQGE